MSQEERYGNRDMTYSAWHRRNSTRRYVGIENATLLSMVDADVTFFTEYDDGTREPIALVETAKDVGQEWKCATVTKRLAMRAGLPAFVLLYRESSNPNPADKRHPDIESFRVRRIAPEESRNWYRCTPKQWADFLLKIRSNECKRLDEEFQLFDK